MARADRIGSTQAAPGVRRAQKTGGCRAEGPRVRRDEAFFPSNSDVRGSGSRPSVQYIFSRNGDNRGKITRSTTFPLFWRFRDRGNQMDERASTKGEN